MIVATWRKTLTPNTCDLKRFGALPQPKDYSVLFMKSLRFLNTRTLNAVVSVSLLLKYSPNTKQFWADRPCFGVSADSGPGCPSVSDSRTWDSSVLLLWTYLWRVRLGPTSGFRCETRSGSGKELVVVQNWPNVFPLWTFCLFWWRTVTYVFVP